MQSLSSDPEAKWSFYSNHRTAYGEGVLGETVGCVGVVSHKDTDRRGGKTDRAWGTKMAGSEKKKSHWKNNMLLFCQGGKQWWPVWVCVSLCVCVCNWVTIVLIGYNVEACVLTALMSQVWTGHMNNRESERVGKKPFSPSRACVSV